MPDRAGNGDARALEKELERRHRADEDLSIDEYKQLLAFAERTIGVWQERAYGWRDRALTERASASKKDALAVARMAFYVTLSIGAMMAVVFGAAYFME